MKLELDLNLLPVLEALIQERSVHGAAERLGITQSAVSHALRRLREHFDDSLFVRSGNNMLPTPRVQSIEPFVLATMEGLRTQMAPSANFDPAQSARSFTINTTDVGEAVMAPRIVSEIRRLAPQCRLQVVSLKPREVQLALKEGEIDLSIGPYKFEADSLYQQMLLEQELVCIGSRSHYGELSSFQDADVFASLPHVAISPYSLEHDAYEWAFDEPGIRRRFVCSIRSFLAVPFLVAQSDIVATLPESLTRRFVQLADLITLPLPFASPKMPVWQVWHRRYHTDAASVWLREVIYSLFRRPMVEARRIQRIG